MITSSRQDEEPSPINARETSPSINPPLIPINAQHAPSTRTLSTARTLVLLAAGAAPILAIPAMVLGLIPMADSARLLVAPLGLAAVLIMLTEVAEARWARTGLLAGLLAVTAYDAVRIPLVLTGVWPDFIPQMGGWITGSGRPDAVVGYLWRYLGDGGGMSMVFFLVVGIVAGVRPTWVTARPRLLSIGYGIFIWSGLIGTVLLPAGPALLFALSPVSFALSLIGHLIYGGVVGLMLVRALRHLPVPAPVGMT